MKLNTSGMASNRLTLGPRISDLLVSIELSARKLNLVGTNN